MTAPSVFLVGIVFGALGLCALLTAWGCVWPLAIPPLVAYTVGAITAVAGAALYGAARLCFGSFRQTWGLTLDRLVTNGVYRYSRNPQMVGWLLILIGVGVAGRSGGALLLAAVYALSCLVWIPVEERILERRFGDEYRRYRNAVPRYLGLTRHNRTRA